MANLAAMWIVAFGLIGCGVRYPITVKPPRNTQATPREPQPGAAIYLEGEAIATDHTKVNLANFRTKPTILIFSQDTCAVCRREAIAIRDNLMHGNSAPGRVNLLTVMVGSPVDDARDWKESLKIPWPVASDPTLGLFRKYCVNPTVPCLFVQLPDRGIVWTKNGEVALSELTSLTGPWEEP